MARSRPSSRGRAEARLDPIRWRPGRGGLIRLAVIAALLVTAALITWSAPQTCAPTATLAGSPRPGPTASSGRTARLNQAPTQSAEALGPPGAVDSGGDERSGGEQSGGGNTAEAPGGSGRGAVPAGTVGVAVRLAEPTALALIHPGDRVDLLRVGDGSHGPSAVAAAALVLSVTGADDPTTGGLLVALTPAEAATAIAEPGRGFAVLVRP